MRTLLCALAGLALLRAAGALAGEWGAARGRGPADGEEGMGKERQRELDTTAGWRERQMQGGRDGRKDAAEPFSPPRGDTAQSTACGRHMAVQRRLDVMEEMVEKTVEHLATEVKGLLGLLEELAWNLPPGPFSPAPDLLGEGEQCRWQRTASGLLSSGAGQASRGRGAAAPHGCRLDGREGPSAPGDGSGTASPLRPNPHPMASEPRGWSQQLEVVHLPSSSL
ncbi:Placenta-specific protein 9 [Plecturocebus cupreus]